jgi:hypothetical protein
LIGATHSFKYNGTCLFSFHLLLAFKFNHSLEVNMVLIFIFRMCNLCGFLTQRPHFEMKNPKLPHFQKYFPKCHTLAATVDRNFAQFIIATPCGDFLKENYNFLPYLTNTESHRFFVFFIIIFFKTLF